MANYKKDEMLQDFQRLSNEALVQKYKQYKLDARQISEIKGLHGKALDDRISKLIYTPPTGGGMKR